MGSKIYKEVCIEADGDGHNYVIWKEDKLMFDTWAEAGFPDELDYEPIAEYFSKFEVGGCLSTIKFFVEDEEN